MSMSNETKMGASKMVVLPRRKFMLVLAVSISISAGVAIALNAFVAVKRGGEDVLPLILSDSFWVCVWSFLVGMAILAVIGMFVKGDPENEKTI